MSKFKKSESLTKCFSYEKKPLLLWYLFIHSELWIVLFFSNVLCLFKFFKARRAPHGPGQIHKVTKKPKWAFPHLPGEPQLSLAFALNSQWKMWQRKKTSLESSTWAQGTAALQQVSKPAWFFFKNIVIWQYFWKEYILYLMSARASSPPWFSPLTLPHWRGSFLCFFSNTFSHSESTHMKEKKKGSLLGSQPHPPPLPGEPLRTSCSARQRVIMDTFFGCLASSARAQTPRKFWHWGLIAVGLGSWFFQRSLETRVREFVLWTEREVGLASSNPGPDTPLLPNRTRETGTPLPRYLPRSSTFHKVHWFWSSELAWGH